MKDINENNINKANQFLKEVVEHLKELADETDKVKQSEFFKHYLDTMARFWKYSYHNQLLIFLQMQKATMVAGFKTWHSIGRRIKKVVKASGFLLHT